MRLLNSGAISILSLQHQKCGAKRPASAFAKQFSPSTLTPGEHPARHTSVDTGLPKDVRSSEEKGGRGSVVPKHCSREPQSIEMLLEKKELQDQMGFGGGTSDTPPGVLTRQVSM